MTTTTALVDARVRQLADDALTMTTNTPKSVANQDDSFVVILGDGQQPTRAWERTPAINPPTEAKPDTFRCLDQ